MSMRILFSLALVTMLAGCVGDDDTKVERALPPADAPDSFLLFPNTQAPLAAGDYVLEVGPQSGVAAGSYTVQVRRDDGSTQTLSGNWPGGGSDSRPLELARAGGLTITTLSATPTHLVLKLNGQVVTRADGTIDLPLSRISSAAYGDAYYAAVDPAGERTTLADWKSKNGFDAGFDSHVIFRDAKDLGYGRDMYARRNTDGTLAFFVNNFVVVLQPGSSTNYGPLNVEAAIAQDMRYLQGTNAIEFSPANQDGPNDNGAMMITKFFTFDKNGKRIASADLDGRGVKHMPGMCWACHGGQTLPLDENGKFQAQSLRSAKLNLLDAAHLEYSPQLAYQRPQLEDGLRVINRYVHESHGVIASRAANSQGHWLADFALELAEGRYGPTMDAAVSNDLAIPAGWAQTPSRPAGVEELFRQVVEPHCVGCHALQGTTVGETLPAGNAGLGNAINFSTWEKFISYRSRIVDYVYRRGLMPMSLRNFESFWSHPDAAPAMLAAFLSEPSLFDSQGRVVQPGQPVARPGASRTVQALPDRLDGNASLFASHWQWRLVSQPAVQPPGAHVSLLYAGSARPQLVIFGMPADGVYEFELVVSNGRGTNAKESLLLTVDSSLPRPPKQLTFAQDILPLLTNDAVGQQCTDCHSAAGNSGSYPGIPVYWTADSGLYQRVMERVDLRDPENSKLLTKPTSLNHGGGIRMDRDTALGREHYSTITSWIREGAVCGIDAVLCP